MIQDIIQNKKMLLICGSGGVGKTTSAAAIALSIAKTGKRVAVLTIDPAKRLANSLGIEKFENEAQVVDLSSLKSGKKNKGELVAMMLDTKSTFDELVIKHASSKDSAQTILDNPLYKKLSSIIVGSQEYMAMEKLYDLYHADEYDMIIVDTPPTVHAIDFLESPQRMVKAVGQSIVNLLVKPKNFLGRFGFNLLEKGSQLILRVLDKVVGGHFLDQVSELLIAFQEMFVGFEGRAQDVFDLLRSDEVSFLIVGACESQSLEEVKVFSEKLEELDMNLEGLILNRIHQKLKVSKVEQKEIEEELEKKFSLELKEKIKFLYENYQMKMKRDQEYIKALRSHLKSHQFLIEVPLLDEDVHDLKTLDQLGEIMV